DGTRRNRPLSSDASERGLCRNRSLAQCRADACWRGLEPGRRGGAVERRVTGGEVGSRSVGTICGANRKPRGGGDEGRFRCSISRRFPPVSTNGQQSHNQPDESQQQDRSAPGYAPAKAADTTGAVSDNQRNGSIAGIAVVLGFSLNF